MHAHSESAWAGAAEGEVPWLDLRGPRRVQDFGRRAASMDVDLEV